MKRNTYVEILCSDGVTRKERIYNYKDFPYDKYVENTKSYSKHYSYFNILTSFDIESTTIRIGPEKSDFEGFMYVWQFCVENDVCMGRTWKEYKEFISRLYQAVDSLNDVEGTRLVVYVHYLSYEFQFLSAFFEWKEIFAKENRVVLKCVHDNIEYRCSYFLSNKNLDKFCTSAKKCLYHKQTGHFDYDKIRTPKTRLNNEELSYCYCDVRGLVEALRDYMEEDNLATIPLTSTGFIRRKCRRALELNSENRKWFRRTALTKDAYIMLNKVKRGGNTHGSRYYATLSLKGIKNYDIASSYPYVMMTDYFPDSGFIKVKPDLKKARRYLDTYCCMFKCSFLNLQVKDGVPIPYIAYHKTDNRVNVVCYNGRVLSADSITCYLTEIDYKIIKKMYRYDSTSIDDFYIAKRGALPKELKDVLRELFYNKTALKHTDPYLYQKSKELLNSVFGMACTDPVYDTLIYKDNEWQEPKKNDIRKELYRYYNSRNSFLPISIGCWVTAHARRRLQDMIDLAGIHTVYVDTDSNKVIGLNDGWLDELNEKTKKIAEECGAYCDFNGERVYMGVYEREDDYCYFKTLGAKKYAYQKKDKKTGKITTHITIAGVNKEKGAKELVEMAKKEGKNPIDFLKPGVVFTEAGGTMSVYNDVGLHTIIVDGVKIETGNNIGVVNSTYTLGITNEFAENLNLIIPY